MKKQFIKACFVVCTCGFHVALVSRTWIFFSLLLTLTRCLKQTVKTVSQLQADPLGTA